MNYTHDKKTLLTVYFLFYYALFLSFFIDHRLLSQYQALFFNYNRDLTELALIASGIPQAMIRHPSSFWMADAIMFLLPITVLWSYRRKGRFSTFPGVVFTICLSLYFLLSGIFWQLHHEPSILYVLLSLLFWGNRKDRFYQLLAGCRYYFLYLFFSAAVWKLARGAIFNGQEMSRILLLHHTDLLSGPCDSWSCQAYSFLIGHPALSWSLYAAAVLLELAFVAGFFTRRWDRVLAGMALLFVAADLLVMRIPYWPVLIGILPLLLGRQWRRRGAASLVIYETTHHENLPALLELSEKQFSRVIVFLKPVSYENLSGNGSPADRWPGTEFIVQETSGSNRTFIRQLFYFIRKEKISHLHLSTLDNNLWLMAIRLWLYPGLQVSLTVHEVNEYFARSFASLRDWTETLAKIYLHGRIRHYSFFLPAMADAFQKRMPGAVTVFIPSRFYASPAPVAGTSNTFKVVVPGSVDANRRMYETVVSFFRNWSGGIPVELVILGNSDSPYGRDLVAQLQQLPVHLTYYSSYVPAQIYEHQIAAADLLWSPLRINKKSSRNSPETYGLTTASGLTADLLLGNAPALAPADLLLPEVFQAAHLPYASPAELENIFKRLTKDPAYRLALRQKVHKAFSIFVEANFSAPFRLLTGLDQEGEEGRTDAAKPPHDNGQ
ncbi:MAG TPA: hypothetical protein VI233_08810 [Puia sp.]